MLGSQRFLRDPVFQPTCMNLKIVSLYLCHMAVECTQVQVYTHKDGEEENPVDFFFLNMMRDQVLLPFKLYDSSWLFFVFHPKREKKNFAEGLLP